MAHPEGRLHRFHVSKLRKQTHVNPSHMPKNRPGLRLALLRESIPPANHLFQVTASHRHRNHTRQHNHTISQSRRGCAQRWSSKISSSDICGECELPWWQEDHNQIEKWSYPYRSILQPHTLIRYLQRIDHFADTQTIDLRTHPNPHALRYWNQVKGLDRRYAQKHFLLRTTPQRQKSSQFLQRYSHQILLRWAGHRISRWVGHPLLHHISRQSAGRKPYLHQIAQ